MVAVILYMITDHSATPVNTCYLAVISFAMALSHISLNFGVSREYRKMTHLNYISRCKEISTDTISHTHVHYLKPNWCRQEIRESHVHNCLFNCGA